MKAVIYFLLGFFLMIGPVKLANADQPRYCDFYSVILEKFKLTSDYARLVMVRQGVNGKRYEAWESIETNVSVVLVVSKDRTTSCVVNAWETFK